MSSTNQKLAKLDKHLDGEYLNATLDGQHTVEDIKINVKYKDKKKSVEYFFEPSLTNQDHDMPLKVLLERYSRGQSVKVFHPHFDFDEIGNGVSMPELDKMSTMERIEYAESLKESIQETRTQLANHQKETKQIQEKESKLASFVENLNTFFTDKAESENEVNDEQPG